MCGVDDTTDLRCGSASLFPLSSILQVYISEVDKDNSAVGWRTSVKRDRERRERMSELRGRCVEEEGTRGRQGVAGSLGRRTVTWRDKINGS
jgi:phenylpyruvate tautomerase PptA (4-oxalocrotonate tautomerase family)